MKTVIVYRNGEEKLRVPAEVRNGILRHGDNILVNSDLIAAQIKSGNITPEIEAMGMRYGDNGKGLIVRWAEDVNRELAAQATAVYNALPQEIRDMRAERIAIDRLFAASDKSLNHDTDDNNVERGYRQLGEAKSRLKIWQEKHPRESDLERAEHLLARAEKEEELASGAMLYDSDGWIGPKEQGNRRDEFLAKAAALRAEAVEIQNKK
jgi:glycine/D-amino acid oxidase-like deaminating enzyme